MGRRWSLDFDAEQLRRLLRNMTPRSQLYRVLKQELEAMGRWKQLPRGKHVSKKTFDSEAHA
jgi:hypothetical protein